jgi:hypothetical protein
MVHLVAAIFSFGMPGVDQMLNGVLEEARLSFELRDRTESTTTNAPSRGKHNASIPLWNKVIARHETFSLVKQTFVDVIGSRHRCVVWEQRGIDSAEPQRCARTELLEISNGLVNRLPRISKQTSDVDFVGAS